MFGSGANHAIYTQCMAQSSLSNRGKKVGLLRGAGTRMAMWFYAMIRLLRLEMPLKATVHQEKFRSLPLNESARMAVLDIQEAKFWKCLYVLLRSVFPALKLLRYCDANKPSMDKIFFLLHRTTQAIEKSFDSLNDKELFGSLTPDRNLMHGDINLDGADDSDDEEEVAFADSDDDNDDDNESNEEGTPINSIMSFGRTVLFHWNRRRKKIQHEYAIAGWALSIVGEVRIDAHERMRGEHRDAIERVVRRLHVAPCANSHHDIYRRVKLKSLTPSGMNSKHSRTATGLIMSSINGLDRTLLPGGHTYGMKNIQFLTPLSWDMWHVVSHQSCVVLGLQRGAGVQSNRLRRGRGHI